MRIEQEETELTENANYKSETNSIEMRVAIINLSSLCFLLFKCYLAAIKINSKHYCVMTYGYVPVSIPAHFPTQ